MSHMQAFGAKAYAEVGNLWQRAALILWVTCIPITALWLFSEPLLVATGQDSDVAALGSQFLRCALVAGHKALLPTSVLNMLL